MRYSRGHELEKTFDCSKMSLSKTKQYLEAFCAFFLTGMIFLFPLPAFGEKSVSLAWEPNTEPDLAGYRIFYRQVYGHYDYEYPVWEGNSTTCTIDILLDGVDYCFVARAFDTEGFESLDSTEACTDFPVVDNDNDGYSLDDGDCNDLYAAVNPGAFEVVYNNTDDDCDPVTLDDDLDGDGYPLSMDCDDSDPEVSPGVLEISNNGKDDDCNVGTLDINSGEDVSDVVIDPDIDKFIANSNYNEEDNVLTSYGCFL